MNNTDRPEYDDIIIDYQAGDITFDAMCSRLWGTGYKYGKDNADQARLSELKERVEGLESGAKSLEAHFPSSASFTGARMAFEQILNLIEQMQE